MLSGKLLIQKSLQQFDIKLNKGS